MMDQFEVTQIWNYSIDQYVDALIERTFINGVAHFAIHKMFNQAS